MDGAGVRASVRFRLPDGALAALVTTYYIVEVEGPPGTLVEDMLHPEWGNLRFLIGPPCAVSDDRGGFVDAPVRALFGPTSRARTVRVSSSTIVGVGLTPQGWAALVGIDAAIWADRMVAADEVLPAAALLHQALIAATGDDERARLLDAWLHRRLDAAPPPDPQIGALLRVLADPETTTVEEVAAVTGMSAARLSRACLRWFGFQPKLLLRRQRFLRTLAALLDPNGGSIGAALDAGYCDQSHFNRDFKRFMGLSPRAYFARPRSILRPASANRLRDVGAALQGLHPSGSIRADRGDRSASAPHDSGRASAADRPGARPA